jgi:hypothetical protein
LTQQIINVGDSPNDGTGDKIRDAMVKINTNFSDIYTYYDVIRDIDNKVLSLTSNNTLHVGTISAINVVSNAQLTDNLARYQTVAGLAANVNSLTSNNTLHVGTISAINVVSNAQLLANLSHYQSISGLTAAIESFNYQTVAGLDIAVGGLGYLKSTDGSSVYQTKADLPSAVIRLTANNTTFAFGKTEGNLNVNNAAYAYGKNEGQLNVNFAANAGKLNDKLEGSLSVSYASNAGKLNNKNENELSVSYSVNSGKLNNQEASYYTDIANRLGFTPVQQGGGTDQLSNKVYIGWNSSTLNLQIDSTNYGSTWPINISGNASTATNAGHATTADNGFSFRGIGTVVVYDYPIGDEVSGSNFINPYSGQTFPGTYKITNYNTVAIYQRIS